jgi:hypothetical protein
MMELFWVCTVLTLLGLAGVAMTFLSGLATTGVDGLFVALVGLLVAAIFGTQALLLARQFGWIPGRFRRSTERKTAPEAGTAAKESRVAVGGPQG